MNFNTYITDTKHIPLLLEEGWLVIKDTWTDCPQNVYDLIINN